VACIDSAAREGHSEELKGGGGSAGGPKSTTVRAVWQQALVDLFLIFLESVDFGDLVARDCGTSGNQLLQMAAVHPGMFDSPSDLLTLQPWFTKLRTQSLVKSARMATTLIAASLSVAITIVSSAAQPPGSSGRKFTFATVDTVSRRRPGPHPVYPRNTVGLLNFWASSRSWRRKALSPRVVAVTSKPKGAPRLG